MLNQIVLPKNFERLVEGRTDVAGATVEAHHRKSAICPQLAFHNLFDRFSVDANIGGGGLSLITASRAISYSGKIGLVYPKIGVDRPSAPAMMISDPDRQRPIYCGLISMECPAFGSSAAVAALGKRVG
jgi:hypothetical protein